MIAIDRPMPKKCSECVCCNTSLSICKCNATGDYISNPSDKPGWCPLLNVDLVKYEQIINKNDTLGQFYNMTYFRQQASAAFARHIFNSEGLLKLQKLSCDEALYGGNAEEYCAKAFVVKQGE